MKFKCEKSLLQNALLTAARAVTTRSTLPVLEGVLLQVGEDVTISGYNMETGITAKLSANISKQGDIVLTARMFSDIVRKMPDEQVSVSVEEDMVHISCGASEFKILGMPSGQFPNLPDVSQEACLELPQGQLKSMLTKTLFAVSVNENKVIHTGALFECQDSVLTIVGLDGFRLALRRETFENNKEDIKFVVPGAALREVEHVLSDSDEDVVRIVMGGRHIQFQVGEITIISRLLDGEFLDYRKAIPSGQPTTLVTGTKKLLEGVERVSLLVNDKIKNPVRLLLEKECIQLSLHTSLGSATDSCPCEGDGGELEIGFNHKYLVDALRASLPDETIQIRFGNPLAPCIIEPEVGNSYLFMVLPVRLKAD